MKTLLIDIETSPNVAHVWGLFKQNVGLNQLMETAEVMCFAAKWMGDKSVVFYSAHQHGKDEMVRRAHTLLDEADVVMHYNGKRFDVPHLHREFLLAGLTPPAPFQQIDLLQTMKRQFRFVSNKLAHVSVQLGLEGKVSHEGHELWVKCMAGDPEAWARMEEYNVQDVQLLEDLYHKLRPWIPGHPNAALYAEGGDDALKCPACASANIKRSGWAYTTVTRYQRYACKDCGKWFRDGRRNATAEGRSVAS